MPNPLISIIIPVYKVENYLDECLESIVNQTYKHLDIILVDDESPDKSGKMCDEWAKKDERIVVIHKSNQGVSEARNTALNVAKGDFIGFCDSDDILPVDAIEALYNSFDETIGIVSGNFLRYKDGETFSYKQEWDLTSKRILDSKEAFELTFNGAINHTIWTKLFRREVVEGIHFPKGRLCEDQWYSIVATMHLLRLNLSLVEIPILTYYYRCNDDSITAHHSNKMARDWQINIIDTLVYAVEHDGIHIEQLPTYINKNRAIYLAILNWGQEIAIIIRKYLELTKNLECDYDSFLTRMDYTVVRYAPKLVPLYKRIRQFAKCSIKH